MLIKKPSLTHSLFFCSYFPRSLRVLMAALAPVVVLILTMIGASDAAWCVCRSDVGDGSLQKSLDYACGAGADCNTISQNGACYNPNSVRSHCSYAVNSYYQKKGQAQGACDFAGTATLSTTDPSYTGCTFPASTSAAGTSSTPSTSTGSTTPGAFSPPNGVLGGGLGPSGSLSTDSSHGGFLLNGFLLAIVCSGMMMIIALLV